MTQNYEPQLVTGPGSLQELPLLLQGQKVLLVHGHRPVEDGLLQKVRVLLEQHGIARENMGQILPDPTFKSVNRGIRLCRKTGCVGFPAQQGEASPQAPLSRHCWMR